MKQNQLSTRAERVLLGCLLLIFTYFTAHGLRMFYSGDDMMNMHDAWKLNPWTLGKSQILIWMPVYRPLGGAIYRIFYAIFGFHNLPLYILCWLMLAVNALLAFPLFKTLGATSVQALLALSLTLVHGTFQDLYLSAGTIYDRLWFLFTALGIIFYARMRGDGKSRPGVGASLLVCALCILSMDSKESGVALPLLLACYEGIFILPAIRRESRVRVWLRDIAPLFLALFVLCLVFVFARVHRTPQLTGTSAYHPDASISVWLSRVAGYFSILTYEHVSVSAIAAALLLLLMAAAAIALRNRSMMFGILFFIITITPVALITSRPGYVLYVPDLGLGLYVAVLTGLLLGRMPRVEFAFLIVATIAITAFHIRNWPGPFPPENSPEYRLSHQFRSEYPELKSGSKLLFVNDDFPPTAWDLIFNIQLLYHDPSIVVHRSIGPPEQRAKPGHPIAYDHVFTEENGQYFELDPTNVAESVRLHILRNYTVGREMDFGHTNYRAYVVSGIIDGPSPDPSRWTRPKAEFKFDIYPAPANFTAKYWVPDFVAKPVERSLSILVNGQQVGALPLTEGIHEISLPVAPSQITLNGFTLVDMNVDKPYQKDGVSFGVILMRAGFEYSKPGL